MYNCLASTFIFMALLAMLLCAFSCPQLFLCVVNQLFELSMQVIHVDGRFRLKESLGSSAMSRPGLLWSY